MKTTNKILIGAVAAFIVAAANASYVFSWQLSENEWQNYDYAVIAAYQDATKVGYLYSGDEGYAASASPLFVSDLASENVAYSQAPNGIGRADISYLMTDSNRSVYTYVIELYNSNNALVDSSVSYTFDSLFTKVSQSGTPGQSAASVVKVSMDIPEPTGAMLLLLGMGLLALKRKRG